MTYYQINFGNYTGLILKAGLEPDQLVQCLTHHKAIRGHGGTIYNLRKYESFHILQNPDETQKLRALTLTDMIP